MIEIKKIERKEKGTTLKCILMFMFVLNAIVSMNIIMMLEGVWIELIIKIFQNISLKGLIA